MNRRVSLCVWCRDAHFTNLQLCPTCEEKAKAMKLAEAKARGIPVAEKGEEPDD